MLSRSSVIGLTTSAVTSLAFLPADFATNRGFTGFSVRVVFLTGTGLAFEGWTWTGYNDARSNARRYRAYGSWDGTYGSNRAHGSRYCRARPGPATMMPGQMPGGTGPMGVGTGPMGVTGPMGAGTAGPIGSGAGSMIGPGAMASG